MAFLELKQITAGYSKHEPILRDFSLSVERGKLVSLLGPSGCGKTTTLRLIAGFLTPREGRIFLNGKDITQAPPHTRNIGLVFQSYALFPHLTVFDNVAFGLRMRKVPKDELVERVSKALSITDLSGLEHRFPSQLSGGQRQRVALSRALVIEPSLLLLDEPLSNLDAKLRVGMRAELSRIQKNLEITMIYVTHDQVEALSLSDEVVVMQGGRIEQIGSPHQIYRYPATPFVARFLGFDNRLQGTVTAVNPDYGVLSVRGQQFTFSMKAVPNEPEHFSFLQEGEDVEILFRPEDARIEESSGPNSLEVRVLFGTFLGKAVQYLVRFQDQEMTVLCSEGYRFQEGQRAFLRLDPNTWFLVRKE